MRIKWLEDAVDDLRAVRRYISEDNPKAAASVAQQIVKTINLLREQPNMGRAGRVPETRELIMPGLPYIIPYRVNNNNVIEILRVFHAAMEWKVKFKESYDAQIV